MSPNTKSPETQRPEVVAHSGTAPMLMAEATLANRTEVATAMNFIMSNVVEES